MNTDIGRMDGKTEDWHVEDCMGSFALTLSPGTPPRTAALQYQGPEWDGDTSRHTVYLDRTKLEELSRCAATLASRLPEDDEGKETR